MPGCDSQSTPTPPPHVYTPVEEESESQELASDESLTDEQYVRLGMPPHDRPWSGDDMAQAAQILAALAREGYGGLPRYRSPRSGKLFARLTSPENLAAFQDPSVPLEARMPPALSYYQNNNQIVKLYIPPLIQGRDYVVEANELMGAMLRASAVVVELVDEFLPTLDESDPTYSERMLGLQQLQRGLADVVMGVLLMLYGGVEHTPEINRLVETMQETFPVLFRRLPPSDRDRFLLQLERMQADASLQHLQPGLEELLEAVQVELQRESSE